MGWRDGRECVVLCCAGGPRSSPCQTTMSFTATGLSARATCRERIRRLQSRSFSCRAREESSPCWDSATSVPLRGRPVSCSPWCQTRCDCRDGQLASCTQGVPGRSPRRDARRLTITRRRRFARSRPRNRQPRCAPPRRPSRVAEPRFLPRDRRRPCRGRASRRRDACAE